MSGTFNFTYLFANGWTIGTQPHLSVDWEARGGERGTFGLGPQVGKMCNAEACRPCSSCRFRHYPIRPDVGGPKWNIQLQATPTIPALIKKALSECERIPLQRSLVQTAESSVDLPADGYRPCSSGFWTLDPA